MSIFWRITIAQKSKFLFFAMFIYKGLYLRVPNYLFYFFSQTLFKVCKCCKVNCVIVLIIKCFSLLRLIFEKKSCTYMCVQLANVSGIYVFKIVSIWFQNISLWKLFITTGEITFVFGPENYMNKSFWE